MNFPPKIQFLLIAFVLGLCGLIAAFISSTYICLGFVAASLLFTNAASNEPWDRW